MSNIIEITDFNASELDVYAEDLGDTAFEPGRTGEGDLYCGEPEGY